MTTRKTKTKEKEPEKKPGAPASHIVSNISASTARFVYTPPAEDDHTGASATAGPPPAQHQQQLKRKQTSSTSAAASHGPSGSQQPPPPPSVSSKPKPVPKPTRTRKDSSSESSESSEGESPPIPRSKPSAKNSASTPPFATTHIGSDDDLFRSISRGSSSHSSRTVVAPPPPPQSQAQASTKSTKPHPLSQVIPSKSPKKPADSDSDDEEDAAPAATQALSAFSTGLPDLANVSLADMDLDAVIRGPRGSISTKRLIPSSDSDEDEDGDASVEAEGLVEDEEPKVSRRVSRMFNIAAGGSSEEEESDEEGGSGDEDEDAPSQRPPRLSLSAPPVKSKSKSHSDDDDKEEEEEEEEEEKEDDDEDEDEDEDETRQPSLEHGNLSFGDVNGMASSVEIDEQGDRAFSEALANDTAVFKLAASNVEENSPESSGRATPEPVVVDDQSEGEPEENDEEKEKGEEGEEEKEEEREEQEEEETTTAKPGKDDRDDSIEPFDSPVKTQARPRSPIVNADLPQPTPRGLRSRMKARTGKAPEVTPTLTPRSSFQDAMKLLEGVGKAEKRKKEKAKKEAAAAATAASQPTPPAEPEEEGEEPEPEKPVRGKRAAAAKSAKLISQAVKPPSTRSQKALAATQPAPSVKPRATRLSKHPPATQPVPVVTPGRTTRAAVRRTVSAQPEGAPAPLPPAHATQESVHKWETLQGAESSSQPDETMNMVDELQSAPEDDGEDLFIASETQQSFPYSQWQPQMHSTLVKGKKELYFPTEEEEEDVEDEGEVLAALDKSAESTTPEKKTSKRIDPKLPPKLSQIMTAGRVFETGASVFSQRQGKGNTQATIEDLVGPLPDEPSDKSESENSDSEAEKPAKSHIPKGRRAGMRSRG
ncbi:hypothetical protein FA13DRAFT_902179 [Coprinellus micaceus]|uniref:Uncharacterized protein n=1 Tax=Coprinellus micaceus TaxID=71717 RepID=A0A4Y7TU24_COPMI|nr:hypothetical protein FA13DRAFT_902179 [Coprinellus micaceus]